MEDTFDEVLKDLGEARRFVNRHGLPVRVLGLHAIAMVDDAGWARFRPCFDAEATITELSFARDDDLQSVDERFGCALVTLQRRVPKVATLPLSSADIVAEGHRAATEFVNTVMGS